MASDIITPERLRELLSYDPATGEFRWKVCRFHSKVGQIAGCLWKTFGYWHLRLDGRTYLAHRIAWLYVHGKWTDGVIDHINGIRHDNRIVNLRDVSQMANTQNQRFRRQTNAAGLVGVYPANGRFIAKITVARKQNHLGCFDAPEEAHAAYLEAKRRLHIGYVI